MNEEFEREKKEKIFIREISMSDACGSSSSAGELRSNTDDTEPLMESIDTIGIQSDKFNKKNVDSHEIKTVHKKMGGTGNKKSKKRASIENEVTSSDCSCDGVFVLNKIFGIN